MKFLGERLLRNDRDRSILFRCSVRLCLFERTGYVRLKPKRIWGYANDKGTHGRSIAAPLTSTKRGRSWKVSASYRGKQRHFDGRLFHGETGHDRPRPKTCSNGSLKATLEEVAQSFVTRNPLPFVLDSLFCCLNKYPFLLFIDTSYDSSFGLVDLFKTMFLGLKCNRYLLYLYFYCLIIFRPD